MARLIVGTSNGDFNSSHYSEWWVWFQKKRRNWCHESDTIVSPSDVVLLDNNSTQPRWSCHISRPPARKVPAPTLFDGEELWQSTHHILNWVWGVGIFQTCINLNIITFLIYSTCLFVMSSGLSFIVNGHFIDNKVISAFVAIPQCLATNHYMYQM